MKDFIYGKSDVLVALLIIAIAGTVIFTRVNAIMEYPSRAAAAIEQSEEADGENDADTGAAADSADESDSDSAQSGSDDSKDSNSTQSGNNSNASGSDQSSPTVSPVTFVIANGEPTSAIADRLVSAKLVENRQAFLNAVEAKSAETRLRAGTFTIPAGATPEQIVDVLIS
jgi:hypothetical protein